MTYNKIATYVALPVLAISAFAISVIAVSPEVSAETVNTSGGVSPPDTEPKTLAQKKAAAEKAKAAAEAKKAKEAKLAAAKAKKKAMIGKTYTECIEGMKAIDDTSRLQTLNDKILQERTARIKKLDAKVAKISDPVRKDQLQQYLAADQASLEAIHASSKGSSDTAILQKSYCEAIFKLQINQFRARQISYIGFVDGQLKAQSTLLKSVDNSIKAVTAGNSLVKSQALDQLATAKSTLTDALTSTGAEAFAVMGAKVQMIDGNYVNNLVKPAEYNKKSMLAVQSAMMDFTEVQAYRKAAKDFNQEQSPTISVTAVTLKDKNGNKINVQRTTKDNPKTEKVDEGGKKVISYKAKNARTAVVELKVNGKDVTKTLTRDGPLQNWIISRN